MGLIPIPPFLAWGPALCRDHEWRLLFTKPEKDKPNTAAFELEIFQVSGTNRNHGTLLVQNICGAVK